MAQFDVYLNPSSKTRNIFPYILDIQNSLISHLATRIVVPLGYFEFFKNEKLDVLTPQVEYEDEQLLLLVPQLASMPVKSLKMFWIIIIMLISNIALALQDLGSLAL